MSTAADPSDSAAMAAEEYRVWKKNTPYLYDYVLSHALEWPSLTVNWVPTTASSLATSTSPITSHRLLLGTHTSGAAPDFLLLADVPFPSPSPLPHTDPQPQPIPSLSIPRRVPHQGEVNRARHMRQKPSIVATKTAGPQVLVFDTAKEDIGRPDVVLQGHETEGYGIDWSPAKEGLVISAGYDAKICLWDVGVVGSGRVGLDAREVFEWHEAEVEDVAWNLENDNVFGSVGDDRMLAVWDLRAGKVQQSVEAHEDVVNSLAFNHFSEWILATGSADSTINLFDLRKLTTSLHTFSSHTGAVLQVEWNPDYETVLASSADDKRVMVWDLCKIGDEQSEEDAEDGPPELLFSHGGHTAKISEFSWSPNEPWTIASVAEDNILQIWTMAESIYKEDYSVESEGDIYAAT